MRRLVAAVLLLVAAAGAARAAGEECKAFAARHTGAASGIAKPMTFVVGSSGGNCAGCDWIAAQGEIRPETPRDFETYIRCSGKPGPLQFVKINSRGGDLRAALALGRLFRQHGVTVEVGSTKFQPADSNGFPADEYRPGVCEEACFYAYGGGRARFLDPDSRLAVRTIGPDSPPTADAQAIVHYLLDMGLPPRAVFRQAAQPVHVFEQVAATRDGIVNGEPRPGAWSISVAAGSLRVAQTISHSLWGDAKLALSCRNGQGWLEIEKTRLAGAEPLAKDQLDSVWIGMDDRNVSGLHKRQGFAMREKDGIVAYTVPLRPAELDEIAKAENFSVLVEMVEAAQDAGLTTATPGRAIAQEIQLIRKNCGNTR